MPLKERLPKKFDRDGLRPLREGYADGWDEAIDEVLTALSGKVLPVEEVLGVEEIEKIIAEHEGADEPSMNRRLAQAIHSEQMRKIGVKGE